MPKIKSINNTIYKAANNLIRFNEEELFRTEVNSIIDKHKPYLAEVQFEVVFTEAANQHIATDERKIHFSLNKTEENSDFYQLNKIIQNSEVSLKCIFFHEFGHAVQYEYIQLKEGFYNNQPVIFPDKFGENNSVLKSLFSKNKNPTEVAQFIYNNMKEAYADMYSMYVMFLETKSTDILDNIIESRKNNLNEFKNFKKLKPNNNDLVSPNQNIEALRIFKKELSNLLALPFEEVHHRMQEIALKGLCHTILRECKINQVFLNDFNKFNYGDMGKFFKTIENEFGEKVLSEKELSYYCNRFITLEQKLSATPNLSNNHINPTDVIISSNFNFKFENVLNFRKDNNNPLNNKAAYNL